MISAVASFNMLSVSRKNLKKLQRLSNKQTEKKNMKRRKRTPKF
jgi:hypothetical protein